MSLFSLCGIVFICSSAVLIIKENGYQQYAMIFSAVTLVIIAVYYFTDFGQAFKKLYSFINVSTTYIYYEPVIKSFGISFVCEICSDTVSELGSEKMGKWIEYAGKGEMLLISVPLISDVLEKAFLLL